jgi:hypothetical protein
MAEALLFGHMPYPCISVRRLQRSLCQRFTSSHIAPIEPGIHLANGFSGHCKSVRTNWHHSMRRPFTTSELILGLLAAALAWACATALIDSPVRPTVADDWRRTATGWERISLWQTKPVRTTKADIPWLPPF